MRWRLVGAGAVTLTVLVGAAFMARSGPERPRDGEAGPGGWRRIPGAFTAPAGATVAATLLFPAAHGCFSVIGTVDAGVRRHTGVWLATGRCDTVHLDWPAEVPPTNPQITQRDTVVDAVQHNGTWMTVVASTAGDVAWGGVLQGLPGHWQLTRLSEPVNADGDVPAAIGVVGNVITVVGRRGDQPTTYLSPSGSSWWDRPLPVPDGGPAEPLAVAGAPDTYQSGFVRQPGPGVIVGRAGGAAVGWSATDGATWQVRTVPEATELTDVAFDGSVFIAVGTGRDGAALVLESADGVSWRPDRRAVPAGARPFRTVHVLRPPPAPDEVGLGGPAAPPPTVYAVSADGDCATAWRRGTDAWTPEPLGCDGVPASLLQLADGRLAAVAGTTLWLR